MLLHRLLLAGIVILFCNVAHAQSGCTDPQAVNYNPAATVNDGSCVYAATYDTPIVKAQLPGTLHESSGIVWTGGKLWTHNDSGNPNAIYSIDSATGNILQTVYIDNFTNVDWEDITADSDYIYVSDCGNNNGDRHDLKILKIAKSDISTDAVVHLNAAAINLSYTDQTSFNGANNFDCEAIISVGDSLYLFSKDHIDDSSRVYKLPKIPGTYAVAPYTRFWANGLITGADYNAQTKEIVLIGYQLTHLNSFMWLLSDYKADSFFSGNKRRIQIVNHTPWQTEGVCWIGNRIFITNERDVQPASLYATDNKWWMPVAVSNVTINSDVLISPNPFAQSISVDNIHASYTYNIVSATGQKVLNGVVTPSQHSINTSSLKHGIYFITLTDSKHRQSSATIVKE